MSRIGTGLPWHIDVTTSVDGVVTVAPVGEIDISTADAVEHAAGNAAAAQPRGGLVLDLRGVTFLDSSGLRVLLALRQHAERRHYAFRVIRGPDVVHRVLEIAGLTQVLEFSEPQ